MAAVLYKLSIKMLHRLLVTDSGRRKNLRDVVGFDTLGARFELIGFPVGDCLSFILFDVVGMSELAGHKIMRVCKSRVVKCKLYFAVYNGHLSFNTAGHADNVVGLAEEVEVLSVAVGADALFALPELGLIVLLIIGIVLNL